MTAGEGAIRRTGMKLSGGARRLAVQGAYLACLHLVRDRSLADAMVQSGPSRQPIRNGAKRSTARALAIHLAREAFDVPLSALGRAAGLHPRSARTAVLDVWERRDQAPEFDQLMWATVRELKEGAV